MNHSKRARSWCFTLNNYSESEINTLTQLKNDLSINIFCFQEEIGKNNTPHLQGVLNFKNAKSFEYIKKINSRAHWEQCRSLKQSLKYCCKEDTRSGKVYVHNYTPQSNHNDVYNKEEILSHILSSCEEDIEDVAKTWDIGIGGF